MKVYVEINWIACVKWFVEAFLGALCTVSEFLSLNTAKDILSFDLHPDDSEPSALIGNMSVEIEKALFTSFPYHRVSFISVL